MNFIHLRYIIYRFIPGNFNKRRGEQQLKTAAFAIIFLTLLPARSIILTPPPTPKDSGGDGEVYL
jgi:hypothetical protein